MRLTACKYVEFGINAYGATNFPEIYDLNDKKIRYIDFIKYPAPLYLSLTGDGQNYFIDKMPVNYFDPNINSLLRYHIDRPLRFKDCRITNDTDTAGTVGVIIWYDEPSAANFLTKKQQIISEGKMVLLQYGSGLHNRFPDVPYLKKAYFKEIKIFDGLMSGTDFEMPIVSDNVIENSYLTLQKGTKLIWENIPLSILRYNNKFGRNILENVQFDFDNSYITVSPEIDVSGEIGKYFGLIFTYCY